MPGRKEVWQIMRCAFILNPIAGNGFASRSMEKLEENLKDRPEIVYRVFLTERPGHATEIAAGLAAEGTWDIVFSVGGDGTAFETAAGLAETGQKMAVIPAGTGNDFVKAVGLPREPAEALAFALCHEPRPVDLGRINDGAFLNICGTGFDVTVLDYAAELKKKYRGLTPYLLGLVKAIAHHRGVRLKLTIDGRTEEGEFLTCAIANGQFFGGGIPICPAARPDDGKLNVVLIRNRPRWMMPFYLPGLMMGRALSFKITKHVLADRVEMESPGMRVNVDGEIFSMDRAVFSLRRGALNLIR